MIYKYSSEMGTKHFFDVDGVMIMIPTDQLSRIQADADATKAAIAQLPANIRVKIDAPVVVSPK